MSSTATIVREAVPAVLQKAPAFPRVLYVATTKSQGGIERYSIRMAAGLLARGIPVIYACRAGSFVDEHCKVGGIPAFSLRMRNSGDLGAAQRLANLIVIESIDIVHVHSRRDYVMAVLAVQLARLQLGGARHPRLILHAHLDRTLGAPARLSGRFFSYGVDLVIAVSSVVRDHLILDHAFAPEFVQLIHNGVDTGAFSTPSTPAAMQWRTATRAKWGIPQDALVIGMVGRLNAKGQQTLMAAAPALIARFPNLYIVFVGPDGEQGDRQRLAASAQAAGIAANVVLPGAANDIPAVMASLDLLAHLPTDEAFGLALVEAMAAGLPTIATIIGGCAEVVVDGVTGCLIPPADSEALAAAAARFFDSKSGPALRGQMGLAGREVAVTKYSFDCQIDCLQEHYLQIWRPSLSQP